MIEFDKFASDILKNGNANAYDVLWYSVPDTRRHNVCAANHRFNIKLFEDPLDILTSVAGPIASGYGTIVESVQALSTRKLFIHLVFLLKEFVTKAYQLDSETLDYQVMDYRIALKVVELEINEEFAKSAKFTTKFTTK